MRVIQYQVTRFDPTRVITVPAAQYSTVVMHLQATGCIVHQTFH